MRKKERRDDLEARLKQPFAIKSPFKVWKRTTEFLFAGPLAFLDMLNYDLQLRVKAHEILPPEKGLEEFYLYHSSNFFNGYIYALFFDVVLGKAASTVSRYLLGRNSKTTKSLTYLAQLPYEANVTAGALSCLTITACETSGIGNVPDLFDIPAGVTGALLYCLVRATSLRYIVKER